MFRELLRLHAGASNGMIMETELPHRFRVQQISPVENDRRTHLFLQNRKVDVGKFIPFRGDDQRFGVARLPR